MMENSEKTVVQLVHELLSSWEVGVRFTVPGLERALPPDAGVRPSSGGVQMALWRLTQEGVLEKGTHPESGEVEYRMVRHPPPRAFKLRRGENPSKLRGGQAEEHPQVLQPARRPNWRKAAAQLTHEVLGFWPVGRQFVERDVWDALPQDANLHPQNGGIKAHLYRLWALGVLRKEHRGREVVYTLLRRPPHRTFPPRPSKGTEKGRTTQDVFPPVPQSVREAVATIQSPTTYTPSDLAARLVELAVQVEQLPAQALDIRAVTLEELLAEVRRRMGGE